MKSFRSFEVYPFLVLITIIPLFSEPRSLVFTNNCNHPVKLMVLYQDLAGSWNMEGWWPFESMGSATLTNEANESLKSNNNTLYYYAEATDKSGYFWGGEEERTFEGRELKLAKHVAASKAKFLDFAIGCGMKPEEAKSQPMLNDGSGTIQKVEQKKLKGGSLQVEAKFNQNGMLEVYDKSSSQTSDVEGQYIVIGRDHLGNSILVSKIFKIPRACPPPDSSNSGTTGRCPSETNGKDWENFHSGYVGAVKSLDVYLRETSPQDYLSIVLKEIERRCGTNTHTSKEVKQAIFAKHGFAGCQSQN